jgi:hypothetical protein
MATTYTHATIEELLEEVFLVRSVSKLHNKYSAVSRYDPRVEAG